MENFKIEIDMLEIESFKEAAIRVFKKETDLVTVAAILLLIAGFSYDLLTL